MIKETPIKELKGIGEKTEKLFHKLGVYTVGDLLTYYPRAYHVYEKPVLVAELEEEKVQSVEGIVYGKVSVGGNRSMQVTTAYVKDLTGTIRVSWFRMPFLRNILHSGDRIIIHGKVQKKGKSLYMEHPELFSPAEKYDDKIDSLQPVYGLTNGLSNNLIINAIKQVTEQLDLTRDPLPKDIRLTYHLAEYNYAIRGIHFPEDKQVYYHARNRLVFDEFLNFILGLRKLREKAQVEKNHFPIDQKEHTDAFIRSLPFSFTKAQRKVWDEISKDLSSANAMSRLIQGDVGSGKTVIAVCALLAAVYEGYQGAMMAPTEVLARQHFASVSKMLKGFDETIQVELLTGSMTAKEKRDAYKRIADGTSSVIIGTHALIQEKVAYKNLALVITDEQHRFGVRQRETLAAKGNMPHVLVMSATPIPRTLAIILYGDLDISVIDELPANRLPIKNCVVDTSYRENAYRFMRKQIEEGRQVYIICPMVEESDKIEAENVMDYSAKIAAYFDSTVKIDYLHGKMKQSEKDAVMDRFAKNETQILVSTTVIEVGIDVANATVMLIENAERFGLAQLHQLRGRVGRGSHQSYCIFMSGTKDQDKLKRLEILNYSNDGFAIANEDLKLRGPGDLFGIRQSGLLQFKLADIYQDAKLLSMANEACSYFVDNKIDDYYSVSDENRTRGIL